MTLQYPADLIQPFQNSCGGLKAVGKSAQLILRFIRYADLKITGCDLLRRSYQVRDGSISILASIFDMDALNMIAKTSKTTTNYTSYIAF